MLKKFKTLAADWTANQNKRFSRSKDLAICKTCLNFYYKNSWHFDKPSYLKSYDNQDEIPVRFTQCPACLEEELASYGGDAGLWA